MNKSSLTPDLGLASQEGITCSRQMETFNMISEVPRSFCGVQGGGNNGQELSIKGSCDDRV